MADRNGLIGSDSPLSTTQRATLAIVLDMIVPPSTDGRLPGAAEVGVLAYLMAEVADVLPVLCDELDVLEERTRSRFAKSFAEQPTAIRQELLDEARARNPALLSRLALEAVTCYYQDDRVLEALGLEARPPFPKGYTVVSGDLSLLDPVRARGKIFRDA